MNPGARAYDPRIGDRSSSASPSRYSTKNSAGRPVRIRLEALSISSLADCPEPRSRISISPEPEFLTLTLTLTLQIQCIPPQLRGCAWRGEGRGGRIYGPDAHATPNNIIHANSRSSSYCQQGRSCQMHTRHASQILEPCMRTGRPRSRSQSPPWISIISYKRAPQQHHPSEPHHFTIVDPLRVDGASTPHSCLCQRPTMLRFGIIPSTCTYDTYDMYGIDLYYDGSTLMELPLRTHTLPSWLPRPRWPPASTLWVPPLQLPGSRRRGPNVRRVRRRPTRRRARPRPHFRKFVESLGTQRCMKDFRKVWFSARIPWFVRGSGGSPV